MPKKNFYRLMAAMLRTGVMGFGGGTALIPVIEEQMVVKSQILTEDEFNKNVMIASITPGALPVQIATGIGHYIGGNIGMVCAAALMALPGTFFTLLLLVLLSGIDDTLRQRISILAAIISLLILWVLAHYVWKTIKQARNNREKELYLAIIIAAFLLSGEKNLYQFLGMSLTPLFALSTLQILGAAFFVILSTRGQPRILRRTIPAMLLVVIYFLCAGQAHILPASWQLPLLGIMVLWALFGLFASIKESPKKNILPWRQLAPALLSWAGFTLLLSLPALLLFPGTIRFIGTGCLSSVMSFGGGDAYLSISQGLFVDSGMVSHSDFYGSIVTIANALPGSILCKVLTGIGYTIGYGMHQSITQGLLLALCAFSCSVSASGCIFMLVWAIYEKYEKLRVFAVVKHFIRPIMSGLLLNVGLSLFLSVVWTPFVH